MNPLWLRDAVGVQMGDENSRVGTLLVFPGIEGAAFSVRND